jgi:uncharacterized membrane protein YhiD involved in acid resistance
MVAGIGMAAGAGLYLIAGATTCLALFALIGLKYVERLYPKDLYRTLTVVMAGDSDPSRLVELVAQKSIQVLFVDFERDYEKHTTTARLSLRLFHRGSQKAILWQVINLLEAAGIPLRSIRWEHGP